MLPANWKQKYWFIQNFIKCTHCFKIITIIHNILKWTHMVRETVHIDMYRKMCNANFPKYLLAGESFIFLDRAIFYSSGQGPLMDLNCAIFYSFFYLAKLFFIVYSTLNGINWQVLLQVNCLAYWYLDKGPDIKICSCQHCQHKIIELS